MCVCVHAYGERWYNSLCVFCSIRIVQLIVCILFHQNSLVHCVYFVPSDSLAHCVYFVLSEQFSWCAYFVHQIVQLIVCILFHQIVQLIVCILFHQNSLAHCVYFVPSEQFSSLYFVLSEQFSSVCVFCSIRIVKLIVCILFHQSRSTGQRDQRPPGGARRLQYCKLSFTYSFCIYVILKLGTSNIVSSHTCFCQHHFVWELIDCNTESNTVTLSPCFCQCHFGS